MVKIPEILQTNPGNPEFIPTAHELWGAGHQFEAIKVCLAGLTADPAAGRGRLLLARFFHELGARPFAVQQIKELAAQYPSITSIQRLLAAFAPGATAAPAAAQTQRKTVAETEFDLGELDILDK